MCNFRSKSRLAICKAASPQAPIFLAFILFLNFSLVCPAAIIKVPEDYSTIQAAIDASSNGDEVIVSPGTYYENIQFDGKNIILRSTDPTGPAVVATTIIDGRSSDSVVTFSGTENESCMLSGFTIANGYASSGGGIYGNGTLATIQNNNITTNTARSEEPYGDGGGLYDCDGLIQNNVISGNSATGYYCYYSTVIGYVYYNCSYTDGKGGGLWGCNGTIINNIIQNNSADHGGGLAFCNGTIENNTISGNSALGWWYYYDDNCRFPSFPPCYHSGSDGHGGGLSGCSGTIANNTISDNIASTSGGGLDGCYGNICSNTISRNSSGRIQADGVHACHGNIKNNAISDNYGDGLYECSGDIVGNTISNNSGSGIIKCNAAIMSNLISGNSDSGIMSCEGPILNNTICNNSSRWSGGGIYHCEGMIINCIVWGNSAPEDSNIYYSSTPFYSCIQDWNGTGRGNISSDPRFVDPLNGNFHLQPDSPCIDAGATCYLLGDYIADIDKECRLAGASVDMGADEYSSSPDQDGDLLVDTQEANYGSNPDNPDTDGDGLKDGLEVIRGTSPTIGNAPPGISIPATCSSIQEGIFLAYPSETITISPGIYKENLLILMNDQTLQSINPHDDDIVSSTVLDGDALFSVITIAGRINIDCIIKGLTICNGSSANGGGICGNGTRVTIEHNKITNNTAAWDGGGIYGLMGIIQNNIISGNSARDGGGISYCGRAIGNNIIVGNSAFHGGGICWSAGSIANNSIYGNSATYGGGIYGCNDSIIRNCIIWENTNAYEGQVLNASTPSYSCIQDWLGDGTGNITSDPQFVDPGNGDFHLQPDSPCIDAGCYVYDVTFDFEGDPRPWNGTSEPRGDGSDYDIGADEFIGPISFSFSTSEEGWIAGSAIVFSPPQCLYEAGSLKMVSQNNTNTFGFWVSPENAIPANERYLYRTRFVVSTNVADPARVPQIRLRMNTRNFQQADYLTIESSGDGGASPTPEGRSYDLYFVPPTNADYCMLAFDLLNFNTYDAAYAELALESVLVERFDLETLDAPTTICAYDFETSQEFWTTSEGTTVFTDPEFLWADGALHLRSTTNTNTFGYWGSDPADIAIEEGLLYRGTFEVRTDEPDRSLVPQMRLRFNTANFQASRSFEITSAGDGANSPGITNTTYDRLYFLPPANCVGEGLIVSFDILNFLPYEAVAEASLILDRATIETLSPPGLP